MDKITIYQFTDPTCVWCWGNEPLIRALDFLYGDKIELEYIMGGLVEDITTLFNIDGTKEQVIRQANSLIYENWMKASQRHGMPISTQPLSLYTEQYLSSFPQNIAYEAAKRLDRQKANHMLRRMREATFLESKRTSQMNVLIELATEVGLSAAEFIEQYTSGDAQADFMLDRMKCRRNGITGFPSYMATSELTSIILGGYQRLSTLHTVIARLSGGKIKPRRPGPSLSNVKTFIKRYKRVFPAEIEVAFLLDKAKTDLMIDTLLKEGSVTVENIGNGIQLIYNQRHQTIRNKKERLSNK